MNRKIYTYSEFFKQCDKELLGAAIRIVELDYMNELQSDSDKLKAIEELMRRYSFLKKEIVNSNYYLESNINQIIEGN